MVALRSIRALPDQQYAVALGAPGRGEFEFVFRRRPADHGAHEIVAPERLRFAPGTFSSLGTYLYRIVGLFHQLVAAADVPVLAMAASGSGSSITLSYRHSDGTLAELAFRVPEGELTPATVSLPGEEAEAAATELGLDAGTVGRTLYPFVMQLRDPIEIVIPQDL